MTDPQDPRRPNEPDRPEDERDEGAPIGELRDLEIDLGEDLGGRVQRDINRRTLAADSLDFSFNVMLATFWEHLRLVIESLPGSRAEDPSDDDPAAD